MASVKKKKVGAVMVVGAGIAGVQASLDLANAGYYVYLVEKTSVIGGRMAQLDKTFPTNDCAMCILSPKLVEVGRHINIELLTFSEVQQVKGDKGDFAVEIISYPRYIDMDRCIACGICTEKCPKQVPNEYNVNLDKRKASYISYEQAVPLKYCIDSDNCIFFKNGKCKACQKFCPADAVQLNEQKISRKINVGSIIFSAGLETFDPSVYLDSYSYKNSKNVVTALEFERILAANGPWKGHMVRPSDGTEPRKMAWVQCVGSRDINHCDNGYCSAVCCMYAIKEAVIAKEHSQHLLDTTIFFMDMRTYGKDFEKYYERAKNEYGVRFIRSRIHTIDSIYNDNLRIEYVTEDGLSKSEDFDMVILSVGMQTDKETVETAVRLGVDLTKYNFSESSSFNPISTNRPGIFVCGGLAGPKDIPQSVMEASAAACVSSLDLSESRATMTHEIVYPVERNVSGQEPRIGVFICNCGVNIGGIIDVPKLTEYASHLPCVVYASQNLFSCSQDTQAKIKVIIEEYNLNRVVVASCSPRTHEVLFQETIREAGLNKYLFEMANIRDQGSWVHQFDHHKATMKAKDLVHMAVAKVALAESLDQVDLNLSKSALVIGAGVAGMNVALNLAQSGYPVHLVEKTDQLGGNANLLFKTWKGEMVIPYVQDLISRVKGHKNITLYLTSEILDVKGFVGNFISAIKCMSSKKTTYVDYGVVILATGACESQPTEYLNGQHPGVLTLLQLDKMFITDSEKLTTISSMAFIQCVGSREDERPYCSRLCCTQSVVNAIHVKEKNPEAQICILYRDIRTYGVREDIYRKARELGILFIRYRVDDKPLVMSVGKKISITITDHVLGRSINLDVDYLVLAAAIEPNDVSDLSERFKIPLNSDGFFLEAHMKLRPVDFANDGLYLAGMAHFPKPIDETIAQANAAAGRALTILAKDKIRVGGVVAVVEPDDCAVCLTCVRTCPYGVPKIRDGAAIIEIASCYGCGICVAECPGKAIKLQHFTDDQILAKEKAAFFISGKM